MRRSVGLLFQPGCFSTFETHECVDLGVALCFSLNHTESNCSKERLYSKRLQAVNILMQSLLLFRCHLLKTEGPIEELSSCWKAAHTDHHWRNDKNNPKGTEGDTARVWYPAVGLLLLRVSVALESHISRKSLFTKNPSRHLREA